MREAVVVSTARAAIGKAYRGAFNDTQAQHLAGHAIAEGAAAGAGLGLALAADLRMLFLSTRVGADEALALGLLNWLVDEDQLESRTHEIARNLAHGPRQALSSMKRNLLDADHLNLEASMDDEVVRHKATGVTADHIGAVRAFVEKRTPVFGTDRDRTRE